MIVLPACTLRRKARRPLNGSIQYECAGGVNFFALGADAALCRQCPVPASGIDEVLRCPHSDIYTFLRCDGTHPALIEVEVRCSAQPADSRCDLCPNLKTEGGALKPANPANQRAFDKQQRGG